TVAIQDGVAPVIRRAVLRRGKGGAPDSLQLFFSEELSGSSLAPSPFLALQPAGGIRYAFAIGPGSASVPGENLFPWLYVIQGTPADSGGATVRPLAGDSLWINTMAGLAGATGIAGVTDKAGNVQANPANVRVPLRISTSLVYHVESVAPDGFSRVSTTVQGPAWSVYVVSGASPTVGKAPNNLPIALGPLDRPHAGGLVLDASHPFSLNLQVHDNLGQFVSRVKLEITDDDLTRLPQGGLPGTNRLYLLWNGTAATGALAGTGAYVYVWNVTFIPTVGPPQTSSGKRIFGMFRGL
ncbi:MAG: hypothetical protein ABIW76_21705, partial [Fibrobacteria bacterium]